jgi:hypothetical protein
LCGVGTVIDHLSSGSAANAGPATTVRGAFHYFSAKTEANDLQLREILAGFLRSI